MAKSKNENLIFRIKFKGEEIFFTIEDTNGGLWFKCPFEEYRTPNGTTRLFIDFSVLEVIYDYLKCPLYHIRTYKCDEDVVEYLGYQPFTHWI